ncbi:unnamed protein product [Vicia faba]|uniref:Uncharacterized protein n=1 Tax=Vicia faba TaxID=3906 RepID=A0AAV1B1D0_VICFA|nr:unnamed protein product [Vicia faba]
MMGKKKGFTVSWSNDDESEDETNNESAKLMVDLSGIWADEVKAYDDSVLYEDLDVFYKDTYDRCEESLQTLEEHRKIIVELESEKKKLLYSVSHLYSEVTLLNSKLNNMSYSLKKMKSKAKIVREEGDTEVDYQSNNKQRRVYEEESFYHESRLLSFMQVFLAAALVFTAGLGLEVAGFAVLMNFERKP